MKGGFSFCGVDIADIGLEYAPDVKDTYVYAPAVTNVHEETFEGHDGGYSYGASKEPKVFTLRCFYEETHIAKGIMARINSLFKVGRKGMLVFKRRPWCYYYATVTETDTTEIRNYLNGLVTITMKAYYPFARGVEVDGRLFTNIVSGPNHEEVMSNTAMLDKIGMEPQMTFDSVPNNTILLFNPGTERAKVSIKFAGQVGNETGDGLTIYNRTTGQKCKYVAFSTENNEFIYTDGITGKTISNKDGVQKLAFLYHDRGFIELEPAFPSIRDLFIRYDGNTVEVMNVLYDSEDEKEWYIGKYIFLGQEISRNELSGSWKKIIDVPDNHTIRVQNGSGSGAHKTSVVLMNEIVVTAQNTQISQLSFIYKPTYA